MNIIENRIPHLKKAARRMLLSELGAVLLAAVALLICYLSEAECDPILAALRYADGPVTSSPLSRLRFPPPYSAILRSAAGIVSLFSPPFLNFRKTFPNPLAICRFLAIIVYV